MHVHCTCTARAVVQWIHCTIARTPRHHWSRLRRFLATRHTGCTTTRLNSASSWHASTFTQRPTYDYICWTRDRLSTWLRMRMVCWFRMRMLWHSLSSARGTIVGCGETMSSLMSPLMCTFLDIEGYFVWVKTLHFGKCTAIHNRAGGATNVVFLLESASSQVIPENA